MGWAWVLLVEVRERQWQEGGGASGRDKKGLGTVERLLKSGPKT